MGGWQCCNLGVDNEMWGADPGRSRGVVRHRPGEDVIMRPLRRSIQKSPGLRRRLSLALARAEHGLTEAHASAAAVFLRETADVLPPERAIRVYFRLAEVPPRLEPWVRVQAFAVLAGGGPLPAPRGGYEDGTGLLDPVRRRIRGRQDDELRRRVEQVVHTARNNVESTYLDGATSMASLLDGVVPPAEAVQIYLDALEVEPEWAARIFHQAMAEVGRTNGSRSREVGKRDEQA